MGIQLSVAKAINIVFLLKIQNLYLNADVETNRKFISIYFYIISIIFAYNIFSISQVVAASRFQIRVKKEVDGRVTKPLLCNADLCYYSNNLRII